MESSHFSGFYVLTLLENLLNDIVCYLCHSSFKSAYGFCLFGFNHHYTMQKHQIKLNFTLTLTWTFIEALPLNILLKTTSSTD